MCLPCGGMTTLLRFREKAPGPLCQVDLWSGVSRPEINGTRKETGYTSMP